MSLLVSLAGTAPAQGDSASAAGALARRLLSHHHLRAEAVVAAVVGTAPGTDPVAAVAAVRAAGYEGKPVFGAEGRAAAGKVSLEIHVAIKRRRRFRPPPAEDA